MSNNELSSLNGVRYYIYGLMHYVFSECPDANLIRAILDKSSEEALDILSNSGNKRFKSARTALAEYMKESDRIDVSGLRSEYTRLFVGPDKLPAPIWESVYVSAKRLLFQRSTLEVREAYSNEGLVAAGYPSEPDDALGTELDFMRYTTKKMLDAIERDEAVEVKRLIDVQSSFLDNHLLKWIDRFAANVKGAASDSFFPVMAELTAAYLHADFELLKEIDVAVNV